MSYSAPTKELWQGRAGSFAEKLQTIALPTEKPLEKGILGFACDEGVRRNQGRVGAKEGPSAFRKALGKLPCDFSFADYGDVVCAGEDLEGAQKMLGELVKPLPKTLVIGGGHEVAYGHFLGIEKQDITIVNFDAHFDLRPLQEGKGSSGTPFLQIAKEVENFDYHILGLQQRGNSAALFDTADRLGVQYEYETLLSGAQQICREEKPIYLTICLDCFSAAHAPGVSAPQPFGILPTEMLPALQLLMQSGRVIAANIAELSPPHDRDSQTAALAAALAATILHTW